MALRAAFIFLCPQGDPTRHRAWVETPEVHVLTIGVQDYESATRVARELVEDGIQAIELCGGFGHLGAAKVVRAIEGKIPVGVVRFDSHPGLGGKSGDALFGD
jgi:hypothetical protein